MRIKITKPLITFIWIVFFSITQSSYAQTKKSVDTKQDLIKNSLLNKAIINPSEQIQPNHYMPLQQFFHPSNTKDSFNTLSQPPIDRFKKCVTVEMQERLRQRYPNMGNDNDFENWIKDEIATLRRNQQTNRTQATLYTIPVVVHVIHEGEAVGNGNNIPAAQVVSQVKAMNADFRRTNDDASQTPAFFASVAADIEVEFKLATVDPNGIPLTELGIHRMEQPSAGPWTPERIDDEIKPISIWDPERYLNIWVIEMDGTILGYSVFPSESTLADLGGFSSPADQDGIVVRNDAFGSNFTGDGTFDLIPAAALGRTTTHEIGHFFGLRHIWGDGDCSVDDFVSDTPLQGAPSNIAPPGCGQGLNTCDEGAGDLPDMVQNYMDFSQDGCMNLFTIGQKERMRVVLENSPRRMELVTSDAADPTDPDGVFALFSLSSDIICEGASVSFNDLSEAGENTSVTGWSWDFDNSTIGGAVPASAAIAGPHLITFNTPGVYKIELEVTGDNGATSTHIDSLTVLSLEVTGTIPETQNFEDAFPPENWLLQNAGFFTWQSADFGAKGSSKSIAMNNFSNNLEGINNIIIGTPSYDMTSETTAFLYFDVAYAGRIDEDNGNNVIYDDLAIVYSDNCGIDFTELTIIEGEDLESVDSNSSFFIPQSNDDWKTVSVDLSPFTDVMNGESTILGLANRGHFGNLLFIDNVTIGPSVDQVPEVANPIEDIVVLIDSPDSVISLTDVFTDSDSDDGAIVVEILENSNPGLVDLSIAGNELTISFTPGGFGSSSVILQATSNGLTANEKFLVRVLSDFEPIFIQDFTFGPNFSFFSTEFVQDQDTLLMADDFTVPAGAIFSISEVLAQGTYSAGAAAAPTGAVIQFYADNNGSPGEVIYAESSDLFGTLALTDTSIVYPLATPLDLEEGTYWFSIFPKMNTPNEGFWNWTESMTDNGEGYYIKDFGDLFAAGFVDWTSSVTRNNRKADAAFELRGEIKGEVPPAAPDSLVALNFSSLETTLTWKDQSDNETSFKIWRSEKANGPFEEIAEVPLNVTTYNDNTFSSAEDCEIWFYQVTAYKTPSGSIPSNTASVAVEKEEITVFDGYMQDFEGDFPPPGWELLNFANGGINFESSNIGFESGGSLLLDNYNNDLRFSAPAIAALPAFDFSDSETLFLSFDAAYAPFLFTSQTGATTNIYDSLAIAYSVDCGISYFLLETIAGESLETADGSDDPFQPIDVAQWKRFTLDVSELANVDTLDNVRIALVNFASFAQQMFIDNFELSATLAINAPDGLSGSSVGGSVINISWNDNANNELEYVVERSENDQSNFVEIATLSAGTTSYADENVVEEVVYFYRVKAIHGAASSDYSNVAEIVNEPLGLSEDFSNAITVYPNPGVGSFNISVEGYASSNLDYEIFNSVGKSLKTDQLLIKENLFEMLIDLSKEPDGVYFMRLKTNEGISIKRILKVQ